MKRKTAASMLAVMTAAMIFMTGCSGDSAENTAKENMQTESSDGEEKEKDQESTQSDGKKETESEEQKAETSDAETQYPLTITDDLGNTVTIEEEPEQVVSLSPANTETLFALGAEEKIAGRTDYCNYPEEAQAVPSVGSYTSPNTELIISMSPDVIFASDYIDDAIRSQVESAGAKVVVFAANDMESVEQDILTAGQILNRNQEAEEITQGMEEKMAGLQEILSSNTEKKSAFIDLGDYYSAGAGSLLGNMLEDIGVENVAADTGEAWPQLSVEKIIESNPDVYISLYTTPEDLKNVSGLSSLDCMKNDRIIYFDGLSPEADLIQRAGPRLAEGTRLLAEQIYPELFS